MIVASIAAAILAGESPAVSEPVGDCRFDMATLSFAGTPPEQAQCLLRKVLWAGDVADQPLPPVLRRLLAGTAPPSPQMLAAAIAAFPESYRAYAADHATDPASQTEAGIPLAYFVIHDTSMPFLGLEPFPRALDSDLKVNDLTPYVRPEPVAHIFLNRAGQIWPGHDFAQGWRATKLESYVIGPAARGRFVHIELVQPRRYAPGSSSLGDTLAPVPGFSREQYRQLAALYIYASARAERWLIPAFHANVDAGFDDAHDDPQNFSLAAFARELAALVTPPRKPPRSPASRPTRALPRPSSAP
jgi:hypothetical protein